MRGYPMRNNRVLIGVLLVAIGFNFAMGLGGLVQRCARGPSYHILTGDPQWGCGPNPHNR